MKAKRLMEYIFFIVFSFMLFFLFKLNFEISLEIKNQKFVRKVFFLLVSLLVASIIHFNDSKKFNWIAVLMWLIQFNFKLSFNARFSRLQLLSFIFFVVNFSSFFFLVFLYLKFLLSDVKTWFTLVRSYGDEQNLRKRCYRRRQHNGYFHIDVFRSISFSSSHWHVHVQQFLVEGKKRKNSMRQEKNM